MDGMTDYERDVVIWAALRQWHDYLEDRAGRLLEDDPDAPSGMRPSDPEEYARLDEKSDRAWAAICAIEDRL